MKSRFIARRSLGVVTLLVSAAAVWGSSPHAAASPPQTTIFQRRPPSAPRPLRFFFGSVQRSQPVVSRRSAASSTPLPGTTLYSAAPQPSANIQRGETVIVRPPVYASVDRTTAIDPDAAARSRLVLPVLPQGAPQVPPAASTESISPAPAEVNIAPVKEKPQQVRKAVPVWPEAPDHPDYGRPIHGRPGFVHPPGFTTDADAVVDVRGFAPGDKVRDPRNGNVFLVPPF